MEQNNLAVCGESGRLNPGNLVQRVRLSLVGIPISTRLPNGSNTVS